MSEELPIGVPLKIFDEIFEQIDSMKRIIIELVRNDGLYGGKPALDEKDMERLRSILG